MEFWQSYVITMCNDLFMWLMKVEKQIPLYSLMSFYPSNSLWRVFLFDICMTWLLLNCDFALAVSQTQCCHRCDYWCSVWPLLAFAPCKIIFLVSWEVPLIFYLVSGEQREFALRLTMRGIIRITHLAFNFGHLFARSRCSSEFRCY